MALTAQKFFAVRNNLIGAAWHANQTVANTVELLNETDIAEAMVFTTGEVQKLFDYLDERALEQYLEAGCAAESIFH